MIHNFPWVLNPDSLRETGASPMSLELSSQLGGSAPLPGKGEGTEAGVFNQLAPVVLEDRFPPSGARTREISSLLTQSAS